MYCFKPSSNCTQWTVLTKTHFLRIADWRINRKFFWYNYLQYPKAVSKDRNKHKNTKYITDFSSSAYKLLLNLLHDPYFPIVLTLCSTSPGNEMAKKNEMYLSRKLEGGVRKKNFTSSFSHLTHGDLRLGGCSSGSALTSMA